MTTVLVSLSATSRSEVGRLLAIAAAVLALIAGVAPTAGATTNVPRLAFVNDWHQLRVVGADGRGERTLAKAKDLVWPVAWESLADSAWSPSGTHVAYAHNMGSVNAGVRGDLRVARIDGSDNVVLLSLPGHIESVRWSPDGRRLAFVLRIPNPAVITATWTDLGDRWDIYVVNVDGSELRPVAPVHARSAGRYEGLDFSPDGSKLVFTSDQAGISAIYTVDVEEFSLPTRLSPTDMWGDDPRWSPDGRRVAFLGGPLLPLVSLDYRPPRLWTVGADGSNLRSLPARTPSPASWSPDGRRLAYSFNCRDQAFCGIRTIGANGRDIRTLTSAADGDWYLWPLWSRGGQIAFVRDETDGVCCVRTLWVMNADGSNQRAVSDASAVDMMSFTWSN